MTCIREFIVSSWIDCLHWMEAIQRILNWAEGREHRTVCLCNVHSVVTARSDRALREAIDKADIATPDGMPVAWLIGRRRGIRQARINGPDLTLKLCQEATNLGIGVAFYGSSLDTLARLRAELTARFPALRITAMISPPFHALTAAETESFNRQLNESGAGIVFVGLGCPKQEVWMADHKESVSAVLIGVGAAFDYIAGTVKRPPLWMQRIGLEWLGRLIAEPRRLWRRYLVTNSIYIAYLIREFCRPKRHHGHPPDP